MKINKRNIVTASLVVALSAAVYLNWQFGDNSAMFTSAPAKELGEAEYVSNQSSVEETTAAALTKKQSQYFAQAKSSRQEAQDKIINIAKEVLDKAEANSKAKESAVAQSKNIETFIGYQTNIENILKAKGFSDCLCCITDKGCSVIVPKSEMDEDSGIVIKDAVYGQTGIEYENITITEI